MRGERRVRGYLLHAIVATVVGASIFGGCTNQTSSEVEPESSINIYFEDVTEGVGLAAFRHVNGAEGNKWFPETMGAGGGFMDYDGDGWEDIVLVGGGTWQANSEVQALWLFRNQGDGTFQDVTADVGLADLRTYAIGVASADYDNDGDVDLLLTALQQNHLFRNENGRFVDVTGDARLADEATWSSSALFFDADNDGWLDLYVGNYVAWTPETDIRCTNTGQAKSYCTPELYTGVPGHYYRNRGDGTFEEYTEAAGFGEAPGKTLGVIALDYNEDGWTDVAVANDLEPDLLYENQGNGTFREEGVLSGFAFDERGKARAGMGLAVGVVDDTGKPSLFVGNFSNEMIGVYRYVRDGLFLDRAAVSRIGRPSLTTLTFGLNLFDVDLDGDLDLFAANGHVQTDIEQVSDNVTYRQRAHLFINAGDGTFEDQAAQAGPAFQQALVARASAVADYDQDGDLDLLITENDGRVHVWNNRTEPRGNYLLVDLEAATGNPDALGAQVIMRVGGQRQYRRVEAASSYLTTSPTTVHFGLGLHATVDTLRIEWPDGTTSLRLGVTANQRLSVRQEEP